jgi:hypothetical protein
MSSLLEFVQQQFFMDVPTPHHEAPVFPFTTQERFPV